MPKLPWYSIWVCVRRRFLDGQERVHAPPGCLHSFLTSLGRPRRSKTKQLLAHQSSFVRINVHQVIGMAIGAAVTNGLPCGDSFLRARPVANGSKRIERARPSHPFPSPRVFDFQSSLHKKICIYTERTQPARIRSWRASCESAAGESSGQSVYIR